MEWSGDMLAYPDFAATANRLEKKVCEKEILRIISPLQKQDQTRWGQQTS
jgi:hypothetical protein